METCLHDTCTRPRAKRDWCDSHYQQQRKTGATRDLRYDRTASKVCTVCGAKDWPDNGRRSQCSTRCQQLASRNGGEVPKTKQCEDCGDDIDLFTVGESGRKKRADTQYCDQCRERLTQEQHRASKIKNADQARDYARRYYWDNRDELRIKWSSDEGRAYKRLAAQKRRALLRESQVLPISDKGLAARLDYYGGKCWICQTAPMEHWDHVKPISKGGSHILANLRPACAKCNVSKNARWPFTPERISYS